MTNMKQTLIIIRNNLYWLIPLIILVIGSQMIYSSAIDYLHKPIVLDVYPYYVEMPQDYPVWMECILLPLSLLNATLSAPLWFQVIYIPCFLWLVILFTHLILKYRGCPL